MGQADLLKSFVIDWNTWNYMHIIFIKIIYLKLQLISICYLKPFNHLKNWKQYNFWKSISIR